MTQHDAHVREARDVRTLFYAEMSTGGSIQLCASRAVPFEKIAWATYRMIEAKRMERDDTWREDLARMEASFEARRKNVEKN